MKALRVTLDQWLAFKTVVDEGSYSRAAEMLNKSQSTISYSLAKLNEQLPKPVLSLEGRKAMLTSEGKVLYRYAEQILNAAASAESVAHSMAVGFESEVTIALDVLQRVGGLAVAFEVFSERFPHTRIRVLETSLSGTSEALLEKQADLVIGGVMPIGFNGAPLTTINMLPVAAPSHPLVKDRKNVSELELQSHRQIVLRDTGTKREQDAGWLGAGQRWTVSHFSSSISLVKTGLAFAFLPDNWIEQELTNGSLHLIPLQESFQRSLPLYLMFADRPNAGPATRALAELIQAKIRV
jgi:DNA-binding transcriptional LysR family regulator|tara:strand:- start:163 stop:1050 length:888 start_codon:yes stop_codon:yes gene_type:complete